MEAALVMPVMFLLLLGIITVGHGVFRYQIVATQAREAARWAAVRGGDYQRETDLPSPSVQQIRDAAVAPMMAGMDPDALALDVKWVKKATNTVTDWDAAGKEVRSVTDGGDYVSNTVRVTVTYQWAPGVVTDPITLQSVCEIPMLR